MTSILRSTPISAVPTVDEATLVAAITVHSSEFRARAACADLDGRYGDLFFSDEIPDIRLAKAVCSECPVREACLAGALERREPTGVWGGELFVNGRILPVKRPRGRPPKYREQLTA